MDSESTGTNLTQTITTGGTGHQYGGDGHSIFSGSGSIVYKAETMNFAAPDAQSLVKSLENDDTVLERISSYDHERMHKRLAGKRLDNTTQWFFDHPDFKAWFTEKRTSSLWCSGKIGSGKTMIATAVIDAARRRSSKLSSPTIFYYCDYEHHGVLSASHIVSSFIKQICEFLRQTSRQFPRDLTQHISKLFGLNRTEPDYHDLKDIFVKMFRLIPDTIYVVDGIDVLQKDHAENIICLIQELFCHSSGPANSRILLLCRDHVPGYLNIATMIPGICQISTYANIMKDIETYIKRRTAEKTMRRALTDDSALLEEVKQTLLAESSGMFLWVYLQLEILWDTCESDIEIRSALAKLPKDLKETYGRCVSRINLQDPRTLRVLKWVSFAARPLHIEELREAIAFDMEDTRLSAKNKSPCDVVIGRCANLVVVDPSDGCVRFAHSSVKQYLENDRQRGVQAYFPEYPTAEQGDLECGELCVHYLSFSDFKLQLAERSVERAVVAPPISLARDVLPSSFRKPFFQMFQNKKSNIDVNTFRIIRSGHTPSRAKYKFLDYAVTNWALQTKEISHTSSVWEKFEQLATCLNETWNFHPWVLGGRSKHSHLHGLFVWAVKEQHKPLLSIAQATGRSLEKICNLPLTGVGESLPALHIASKLGYKSIIEILLRICDANVRDEQGYTALHHAASRGHIEISRLLISAKGVKVDPKSKSLCTPLWLAAANGHGSTVSLLIKKNANIEAEGNSDSQTPLSQAARNGHYAVVKLLLENGAVLESHDEGGRTPLSWAVKNWHEAIMKLLLEEGASPDSNDVDSRSLLSWASSKGYEMVVSKLLMEVNEIDFRDNTGRTPLLLAANNGHEGVMKLLLEARGIQLTPLSWAAENGLETAVKLLIENGADSANDDIRRTALLYAAEYGHDSVVKLLLEKCADYNAQDTFVQTALLYAAEKGHDSVVRLLLEKCADRNAQDNFVQTALSYAAEKGHESVMTLLLNAIGIYLTPLSWAAENGHDSVVRLLLEKGADRNADDNIRRTALLYAAQNGHESVMALLLNALGIYLTPLSWAAENGYGSVVRLLLEKGADCNADGHIGRTALSYAARNGHDSVVRLLLENSADINAEDYMGGTALLYAAEKGHDSVVGQLLKNGADHHAEDSIGRTALSYATENRHDSVVRLLVDYAAEDDIGPTKLLHAAENGHDSMVRRLLTKGVDFNAQDDIGRTALSYAAQNGHDSVVRQLLKKGANYSAQDIVGGTALSYAAENGHIAVMKQLFVKSEISQTPLLWAATMGYKAAVVNLILKDGADLDAKANSGDDTPFLAAARNGHESVVRILTHYRLTGHVE